MKKKVLALLLALALVASSTAAMPDNAFSVQKAYAQGDEQTGNEQFSEAVQELGDKQLMQDEAEADADEEQPEDEQENEPEDEPEDEPEKTDFEYSELDDGTLELTKYSGKENDVEIPSEIDEKKVSSIGSGLFKGSRDLTSVSIPDGVKTIGSRAFENCIISKMIIPQSVTDIGDYAFYNCTRLETVGLSRSTVNIGEKAFRGTKWIKGLYSDDMLAVVNDMLIDASAANAEKINVPSGVKTISKGVFADMKKLVEVNVPASVSKICTDAFRGCTALKSLTLPASVTAIEDHAFGYSLSDGQYIKQEDIKLFGAKASAADKYAKANGFDLIVLGEIPARIYGSNRYETAFGIADRLRALDSGKRFSSIIVASGLDFADALSAAYLAKVKNAPILLTAAGVTDKIGQYIKDNCYPDATVYIVGGTAAVPSSMEKAVKGLNTVRLAGPNRYITNLLVLKEAGVTNQEILLASGLNYADALSASAAGRPIMLTAGDGLTANQKSYLKTLSSTKATIIGGTGAVSSGIQQQAKEIFKSVSRVGGANRYETSEMVAEKYYPKSQTVTLAYGLNYPDGLCGGPLALKLGSPLVLTASKGFYAAKDYAFGAGTTKAVVLGGTALISDESVRAVTSATIRASVNGNSITLNWKKVNGAVKYEIYNVTGTKARLGTAETSSYTVNGKTATTYKFSVVPFDANGNAMNADAMFVIAGTDPAVVSGLKAGTVSSSYIEIMWNDTAHTFYEVYRKNGNNYTLLGTTGANRFTDTNVKIGTTYEYIVRAVYTDETGKVHYGKYSFSVKASPVPSVPIFTEPSSSMNSITVRWNKTEGMGYYVSIEKDGKQLTYYTTNNYYTFSNLTRNTAYKFSLYGVRSNGASTYRTSTSQCTFSTDSTVKSKTNFKIYASPNTNTTVLYSGGFGVILTKKGSYTSTWYKVYIPGTNNSSFGFVLASQVAGYVDLNFSPIAQLGWAGGAPLPTGCETTALATLLACHLGLPCTKNLLADKFLTTVGYWVGDPNYASWGSPYDKNAYGVMAPALAATANRFLKSIGVRDKYQIDVHTDNDKNMSWHKLDTGDINHTSGLDLEGIKAELEKGHAVQIWWITRGADPDSYTTFTIERGGKYSHDGTGTYQFTWVGTQHGSVISGYDEATGQFIIADVGWGYTVRHSISHFMKIYTIQGRQSIVIYKK